MGKFFKAMTLLIALSVGLVHASSTGSLQALIQDYEYQMTVEWDQSDREFANQANMKFHKGLQELRAQGMDADDVLTELQATLRNPASLVAIENLRNEFNSGSLDMHALAERVVLIAKKDQMQGASWSGRTAALLGVVAVLTIAWIAWTSEVCRVEGCRWDGTYNNNYYP